MPKLSMFDLPSTKTSFNRPWGWNPMSYLPVLVTTVRVVRMQKGKIFNQQKLEQLNRNMH
jgi:hypothetical protein